MKRVLSLYRTATPVLSWKTAKIWRVATWNVNKIYIRMILLWKSASRHSAVRVVGRFTAKLTKQKFHHSGRRDCCCFLAFWEHPCF